MASMKVQATSTMAKEIAKALKAKGLDYKAKQVKLTEREYSWYVGDTYDAEDYGDYDYTKQEYRAIMIIYPDNYYACPRYLSTRELKDIFTSGDTLEKFMAKVVEAVEI